MTHHLTSGSLFFEIQPHRFHCLLDNSHVIPGLVQIFFPLFFQLIVLRTAQRSRIDLDSA